jgi:hypothetical protein
MLGWGSSFVQTDWPARHDNQEKKRGTYVAVIGPALVLFRGQRVGARVTCSRSLCDAASSPPGEPRSFGLSSTSPVPRLHKPLPGGTPSCVLAACQCRPSKASLSYAVARWQRFCSLYIVMLGAYVLERADPRENGSLWEERGGLHLHTPFAAPGWPWVSSSAPIYVFHVYVFIQVSHVFLWMLHMLQWLYTYVTNVSSKCFNCFIWMSHVFIWMLHMLQWIYAYVASVCSKCFTYFIRMLQAYVLIGFTLCQYFAASAALHVIWLAGTHALHAHSQHGLSLSCRPAPTTGRNPNGRALSGQSACRAS